MYKYIFITLFASFLISGCSFKIDKKCNYEEFSCEYDKSKVIHKLMKFYQQLNNKNYDQLIGPIMVNYAQELEHKLGKAEVVSCYGCLIDMEQENHNHFFAPELKKLITKYQEYQTTNQYDTNIKTYCRGYNFIIDAQDEWITNFKIDVHKITNTQILAKVTFDNFDEKKEIDFEFQKIKERWLIKNIHNRIDNLNNHLRNCLKGYEQQNYSILKQKEITS